MDLPPDLDLPHDLAKQALAATGGKSTVKATEWILNRRAEVHLGAHSSPLTSRQQQQQQQQQLQFHPQEGNWGAGKRDNFEGETSQRKVTANAAEGTSDVGLRKLFLTGKGREEDTGSALLPSPLLLPSASLRISGKAEKAMFKAAVVAASEKASGIGLPNSLERHKPASLYSAIDWGASNPTERPPSIGSCSPLEKPSENEEGPLKTLKPIRNSEPVEMAYKSSRSPETVKGQLVGKVPKPNRSLDPGENAKPPNIKAGRPFPAPQDVNCKRQRQEDPETKEEPFALHLAQQEASSGKPLPPLAERMQPSSIDELFGQDHLLGPQCIVRSLLEGESLPCIILWGPPGTGKTSLARFLARSASCRFIALPSTENAGTEVHEILDEAKQAKKHGQRTLVFVETLQSFKKFQQEAVLSAIEAGYVILVGATTDNPANELTPALLSKCRVFTLRKLQPDQLVEVMERAILDKGRGVLATISAFTGVESVGIEDDALLFLADSSDGDARLALTALEAAVTIAVFKDKTSKRQERDAFSDVNGLINKEITVCTVCTSAEKERSATNGNSARRVSTYDVLEHLKANFQFCQEEYAKPFKKFVGGREVNDQNASKDREGQKLVVLDADKERGFVAGGVGKDGRDRDVDKKGLGGDAAGGQYVENPARVVVTVTEAKEALQWSLEKSAKDNQILITAMLKSMRGGNGNAAIYWLARVLEGGENPLNVAQHLIIFASEDVGLADTNALVQAVASYQACQLLGMPGCSVSLTQCVVYLSMAPKSEAVKHAILAAQRAVRSGGHNNEPVRLHVRTASGSIVKESGNLPPSLRDHIFLHWPESQSLSSESLHTKEDR